VSQSHMDSEPEVTTLRLCPRCQIYKPKKDFVYVAGDYVCTDCSYWITEEEQLSNSAKPARDNDE
jgi:transcription initiation factor TFIIIB Brf1 subunit/transcription initiation factor TFIIB